MKTIAITGSSKGIGKAVALHYLHLGWKVLGCSRRPAEWSHPNYQHTCLDVQSETQVVHWFRTMKKEGFTPDAVLHNAGEAALNHSLLTDVGTFQRLWSINTLSAFLVGREASKLWVREKKAGKLLFISTIAVPLALAGEAAYVAAKAGLEGLAMSWANEFKPNHISVNVIGPGPVDTALWRSVPSAAQEKLLPRLKEPRLSTFNEVCAACDSFLLSEEWRTGEKIYLNL